MCKKFMFLVGLLVFACAWAGGVGAEVMAVGPEDGLEAAASPVLEVRVASPRAALMRIPPQGEDAAWGPCPSYGAAFNFARPDLEVALREGTLLKIRLSQETEGLWYEKSFGLLGTFLILELKTPADEWQILDWDLAKDVRHGPSVGVARDVSTRFKALDPGTYRLRAKVFTYALPLGPEDDDHLFGCADDAYDLIHITVHVAGDPVPDPVPEFPEPAEDMPHAFLE